MSGSVIIPDKKTAYALQTLARHRMIIRILNDILMDLQICEIEGWDKTEYIRMLRKALEFAIK